MNTEIKSLKNNFFTKKKKTFLEETSHF